MTTTDGPLLVSAREAAKLLGISERTLYSLTKSGDLPCLRVGRRVLYSRAQLAQWISERLRAGGAE